MYLRLLEIGLSVDKGLMIGVGLVTFLEGHKILRVVNYGGDASKVRVSAMSLFSCSFGDIGLDLESLVLS